MSKVILISGPTSSGKSQFALNLAKKINGEIINADSMQVFKEISVLSARPKKSLTKKIKHHLYGIKSVKNNFSTGEWLNYASKKINEIKKKNKVPVLTGGTGLYFKALTGGLVSLPKIPFKFREKIRKLHSELGQKKFYDKLVSIDPLTKERINKNDVQRSIRAFEIKNFTKKSIFQWYKKTKKKFPNTHFIKLYIDYPRTQLIKKIEKRVDLMFEEGAINEVIKFQEIGVKKDKTSNKIIGIQEIREYLDGKRDLKQTKELISIKTRQYAKRQSTWARGQMSDWQKINPKNQKSFIKKFKI